MVDVTPLPDAVTDVKYCEVQLEVKLGAVLIAHWPKACRPINIDAQMSSNRFFMMRFVFTVEGQNEC